MRRSTVPHVEEIPGGANYITDRDYRFICDLVYEFSRISLGDNKKELVTARLGKRLRALNLKSFAEYRQYLESDNSEEELVHLVDCISTNHTHFFREIKHFDFLRERALPDFCLRFGEKGQRHFYAWSAACSSGDEPYSMAISLAEFFTGKAGYDWRIEATDISTKVLKTAQTAVYPKERVQEVQRDLLRRYFQKGVHDWDGYFRVKKTLRDRIYFSNLNLLQYPYPFHEPFHVIFCRNVMIYFDRPTQEELINQLHHHLHIGGFLMIGHAESLTGIRHPYRMIKPSIYQKISD
ncbi:MAG: CheR family methyltransferase [Verrucomicrobiota bacterium]